MSEALRVTALTPGVNVPSARFRVGQYLDPLINLGVEVDWRPAPVSAYPPAVVWQRPFWLPLSLIARAPGLLASHRTDLTLFNREFVSTLATLEGWAGRPRVFDVDDAIFLRRGGQYAARLAQRMDLVIAGNSFLAEYFTAHNPNTVVLPTAVDTNRFTPGPVVDRAEVVVGWSGTSGNFPYLEGVMPAVAEAMRDNPALQFHVSADRAPNFAGLDPARVMFVPWSPAGEVPFIRSLDIGLMPLPDDDWSRGKCAFKMLLYLACGVPAVTTPVGVNAQLLAEAELGVAARDADGWKAGILDLAADATARRAMGAAGRTVVERDYSLAVLAPRLADMLRTTVAGRGA